MNMKKRVFNLSFIIVLLNSHISYAMGETSSSIGNAIFKIFFYLFIFIMVIIFAIYGTKFIAKNSKRFVSSKYIQVLDRISLDVNNKIIIVEINKYIYILGINNNIMKLIDKIPKEDFETELVFENHLEWHRNKYADNNDIFSGFKSKTKEYSTKWNKFIGKEDEDDEK